MLVQAVEVDYDYNNSRVSAVGNVQMFYNGTSVEADKVIYDQKTKRLHAEGNIRMTDADGKITYANIMDLSDDYRDGFVNSLRVDTADADAHGRDPRRPHQRQLHRVRERRLYRLRALQGRSEEAAAVAGQGRAHHSRPGREDAVFRERPARILRRSDGVSAVFLDARSDREAQDRLPDAGLHVDTRPTATASKRPFYWAIAPDYDATFTPRFTTQQGVLMQGEFRQRLINGSYQIRAYGIDQLDPGAFAGQPGDRQFRGGVETKGQFALNDKWVWGWDGVLLSDYYFCPDYRLAQYKDPLGSFLSLPTEAISQLYLTGVGNRSYFDARTIYYLSFSGNQSQVPVVHPVIDYSNVINQPDPRRRVQLQDELHQPDARDRGVRSDHDARAITNGLCTTDLGRSAGAERRRNCLLRGMPGTYTRADRRSAVAPVVHRSARPRSGRRSRACAPTRSTPRSRTSPAFRTSCRPATPRRCA